MPSTAWCPLIADYLSLHNNNIPLIGYHIAHHHIVIFFLPLPLLLITPLIMGLPRDTSLLPSLLFHTISHNYDHNITHYRALLLRHQLMLFIHYFFVNTLYYANTFSSHWISPSCHNTIVSFLHCTSPPPYYWLHIRFFALRHYHSHYVIGILRWLLIIITLLALYISFTYHCH